MKLFVVIKIKIDKTEKSDEIIEVVSKSKALTLASSFSYEMLEEGVSKDSSLSYLGPYLYCSSYAAAYLIIISLKNSGC